MGECSIRLLQVTATYAGGILATAVTSSCQWRGPLALLMCGSSPEHFPGSTNGAAKSGWLFSHSPSLLSSPVSCCAAVRHESLPSRYLFFAESGTHSIVAFFNFFLSHSDFTFQLGDEFCWEILLWKGYIQIPAVVSTWPLLKKWNMQVLNPTALTRPQFLTVLMFLDWVLEAELSCVRSCMLSWTASSLISTNATINTWPRGWWNKVLSSKY